MIDLSLFTKKGQKKVDDEIRFAIMTPESVNKEISKARYTGFAIGLLSAGIIAFGGLELTLRLKDIQILSGWEQVYAPAIQRHYDPSSEENIKLMKSNPEAYDPLRGMKLSEYIIKTERENSSI